EGFQATITQNQEQARELMDKLAAVAQPGAVFAEPVSVGDYTVITASEIRMGAGMGFGGGFGEGSTREDQEGEDNQGSGAGVGGGAGGMSAGRPVAAIVVGPEGVHVEPIVDVTTLGIALFTAVGAMFMMLNRMRKAITDR
ncbi:MAG TPA: hypothetical protein VLC95_05200, partial [Anaerolineae bacterium]|nr:hypothetical protein [Anaerolineae bacterium]